MPTPEAILTNMPDARSATAQHSDASMPVAHHFDDWKQQYESLTLGMWLFLVTEVMFFGGLFATYMIYRAGAPETFDICSRTLGLKLGAINTVVLLTSSFTMALAVHAAHKKNRALLIQLLLATIVLGSVFLGIKMYEYREKFVHHRVPIGDRHFDTDFSNVSDVKPNMGKAKIFFGLYFAMTGVHAIHMVIGIVMMGIMAWYASRDRYTQGNFVPIELAGLYWHFVDIVWIFLFPLLYLIDRS